jgi:predicted GNAT family N-acyltransferase
MYLIRRLKLEDINSGFLSVLSQLSNTIDTKTTLDSEFIATFQTISKQLNHKIFVIEHIETKLIVGTGTLIICPKFIHNNQNCGYIEDVVIDKNNRKQNLGSLLMETLIKEAKQNNCYKVILNCKPELKQFYHKFNFENQQIQMAKYF